jgi:methyl-accepting chemotaxis protein
MYCWGFSKLSLSSSRAKLALFSVSPADRLHNIVYRLHNIADELHNIADGLHNIADGLHDIADGLHNIVYGLHNIVDGLHNITEKYSQARFQPAISSYAKLAFN